MLQTLFKHLVKIVNIKTSSLKTPYSDILTKRVVLEALSDPLAETMGTRKVVIRTGEFQAIRFEIETADLAVSHFYFNFYSLLI